MSPTHWQANYTHTLELQSPALSKHMADGAEWVGLASQNVSDVVQTNTCN